MVGTRSNPTRSNPSRTRERSKKTASRQKVSRAQRENLLRSKNRIKGVSRKKNIKTRRIVASTDTRKNLAGFLNPFSSTHGARIPDGSVVHSLGSHHRNVVDCSLSDGSTWNTWEFLMYPGIHGGCIYRAVNLTKNGGVSFGPVNYVDYNNNDCNLSGTVYTITTNPGNDTSPAPVLSTISNTQVNGGLSRWRAVSQALRLTLVNSDENNDGWWEACRFAYTPTMDHWEVGFPAKDRGAFSNNQYTYDNGSYRPTSKIFDAFIEEFNEDAYDWKNIAEQKSYAVGALKHIHTKQFNLAHVAKDEEFKQVYKAHALETQDHQEKTVGTLPNRTSADNELVWDDSTSLSHGAKLGSVGGKRLHDSFVDENLDFLYIRVHMGVNRKARILLENATNHEIIYENDSPLAKFMLPSVKHPATNTVRSARQSQSESPVTGTMDIG